MRLDMWLLPRRPTTSMFQNTQALWQRRFNSRMWRREKWQPVWVHCILGQKPDVVQIINSLMYRVECLYHLNFSRLDTASAREWTFLARGGWVIWKKKWSTLTDLLQSSARMKADFILLLYRSKLYLCALPFSWTFSVDVDGSTDERWKTITASGTTETATVAAFDKLLWRAPSH